MKDNKGAAGGRQVSGNRAVEPGIAKRDADRVTFAAKQAKRREHRASWGFNGTATDRRWS